MIVLGVCDSHESHACIVVDGRVVAAAAEERFSRLKADMTYPRKAIDAVMETAGIGPKDIDTVAYAGLNFDPVHLLLNINARFSISDWVALNRQYWGPRLLEGAKLGPLDAVRMFKDTAVGFDENPYRQLLDRLESAPTESWRQINQDYRRDLITQHLNISPDKVTFYRHEDCHKIYGLFSCPSPFEEALVLTAEGGGDDSSATSSEVTATGRINEFWRSNEVGIGRLYRYVTLVLGMKPSQHEYKVMGLAPYGTEYHGQRSLDFFRTINSVEGDRIVDNKAVPDLYYSVRDALEGERFDGIAWGLQQYLEETLESWVRNNIEMHGHRNVVLSGGVAQNIKACKVIAEMPEVEGFWAGPIAGDGSLGIGAAWLAGLQNDPETCKPVLESVYLGTEYGDADVHKAIDRHDLSGGFDIVEKPSPDDVAAWLDSGLVVSRFSGRMEFGQRALGNRSILADPRRWASVERINTKIKYRDFWMPFTPSMMIEESERLIDNPKSVYSPYMTMAFDLKPEFKDIIPAATHPADKTVRPQMLRRENNPGYYSIIEAFKNRTGLGAILNTSFNLHGDAIVETPDNAVDTLLRSEIDILLFDDVAICRRLDDAAAA